MTDEWLEEARTRLPSAISTLPANYLDGNAAPLLLIVEELKRSFLLELRIIQTIKRTELREANDETRWNVARLTAELEDYGQSRWFSEERTHCGNIDRIARTLIAPQRLAVGDSTRVEEVERLLAPLRDADREFVDELEPLMEDVLQRLRTINDHVQETEQDPARLVDAQRELADFDRALDPRVAGLTKTLKEMSRLANELLDRL